MYYTIRLDLTMGIAYICMVYGLPYLMTGKWWLRHQVKLSALIQIIVFAVLAFYIATLIPDPIIANRRLHAIWWWASIAYAYYLAVRDSLTSLSFVQYIVFGILICNMAGIGNELVESILQSTTSIIFAPTIWDTWWDLWANIIGSTIMLFITSWWYYL